MLIIESRDIEKITRERIENSFTDKLVTLQNGIEERLAEEKLNADLEIAQHERVLEDNYQTKIQQIEKETHTKMIELVCILPYLLTS